MEITGKMNYHFFIIKKKCRSEGVKSGLLLFAVIISWPYLYGTRSHPLTTCFIIRAVICPSLSSTLESNGKSSIVEESQMHSMHPSFCAEQLCSGQFTWNGEAITLVDAFRAWKWFCGYLVLWQVCTLITVFGSKHPSNSPSKWQGVGVNRKRSKNNFSLWRIGLVDLWKRQISVDALEHASYSSGHIVCAPVIA